MVCGLWCVVFGTLGLSHIRGTRYVGCSDVICGVWYVVCAMWYAVYGMWDDGDDDVRGMAMCASTHFGMVFVVW